MPTADYSKTVIYKIINYDHPELVYVGSTTSFKHRKYHHKFRAMNLNNPKGHLKLYENIRKFGGWDSWQMIPICEFPCNNRREAEIEEDKYMLELKGNLNMNRSYLSKERQNDKCRLYREKRKDELGIDGIKTINLKYRQNQIDKHGIEMMNEKMKKYDESRSEQKKQYYKERKAFLSEKCECECGTIVCRAYMTRHMKTNTHNDNLKLIMN